MWSSDISLDVFYIDNWNIEKKSRGCKGGFAVQKKKKKVEEMKNEINNEKKIG